MSEVDDFGEDPLPPLKEALDLFQKCLAIQEKQQAEAREMMAQEPPADDAAISPVRMGIWTQDTVFDVDRRA